MPWPQDAYVGQKVVCVNNGRVDCMGYAATRLLQIGEVYTIHRIYSDLGIIWIALTELPYAKHDGWLPSRFRPVQSTETGMAILRSLLKPTKVREDA